MTRQVFELLTVDSDVPVVDLERLYADLKMLSDDYLQLGHGGTLEYLLPLKDLIRYHHPNCNLCCAFLPVNGMMFVTARPIYARETELINDALNEILGAGIDPSEFPELEPPDFGDDEDDFEP